MSFFLHRIYRQVCPHCKSTGDQIILFAKAEVRPKQTSIGETRWVSGARLRAFLCCSTCNQPSMVVLTPRQLQERHVSTNLEVHERFLNLLSTVDALYQGTTRTYRTLAIAQQSMQNEQTINSLYVIGEWFPQSAIQRPDRNDIPSELNEAFDELAHVLASPTHTAIQCRRILEAATRKKLKKPKRNLVERIDQLREEGFITNEIAHWAHALRQVLNDATHGESVSPQQADEILNLTRVLVEILYVYPAKIEAMRK